MGNFKTLWFWKAQEVPYDPQSIFAFTVYLENFNRKEVPDQIVFRNRFIAINIDGESTKARCNYCKKTDHLIENCPLKIQPKETQPPDNLPQPKQSYAQTVTSTPKISQPPFLHPSTKVKLNKLNIKKTT